MGSTLLVESLIIPYKSNVQHMVWRTLFSIWRGVAELYQIG